MSQLDLWGKPCESFIRRGSGWQRSVGALERGKREITEGFLFWR